MSESRISAQEFISGKLRVALTDYNSTARVAAGLSTNWIYPDKPRIMNISGNKHNFPRVSVTALPKKEQG